MIKRWEIRENTLTESSIYVLLVEGTDDSAKSIEEGLSSFCRLIGEKVPPFTHVFELYNITDDSMLEKIRIRIEELSNMVVIEGDVNERTKHVDLDVISPATEILSRPMENNEAANAPGFFEEPGYQNEPEVSMSSFTKDTKTFDLFKNTQTLSSAPAPVAEAKQESPNPSSFFERKSEPETKEDFFAIKPAATEEKVSAEDIFGTERGSNVHLSAGELSIKKDFANTDPFEFSLDRDCEVGDGTFINLNSAKGAEVLHIETLASDRMTHKPGKTSVGIATLIGGQYKDEEEPAAPVQSLKLMGGVANDVHPQKREVLEDPYKNKQEAPKAAPSNNFMPSVEVTGVNKPTGAARASGKLDISGTINKLGGFIGNLFGSIVESINNAKNAKEQKTLPLNTHEEQKPSAYQTIHANEDKAFAFANSETVPEPQVAEQPQAVVQEQPKAAPAPAPNPFANLGTSKAPEYSAPATVNKPKEETFAPKSTFHSIASDVKESQALPIDSITSPLSEDLSAKIQVDDIFAAETICEFYADEDTETKGKMGQILSYASDMPPAKTTPIPTSVNTSAKVQLPLPPKPLGNFDEFTNIPNILSSASAPEAKKEENTPTQAEVVAAPQLGAAVAPQAPKAVQSPLPAEPNVNLPEASMAVDSLPKEQKIITPEVKLVSDTKVPTAPIQEASPILESKTNIRPEESIIKKHVAVPQEVSAFNEHQAVMPAAQVFAGNPTSTQTLTEPSALFTQSAGVNISSKQPEINKPTAKIVQPSGNKKSAHFLGSKKAEPPKAADKKPSAFAVSGLKNLINKVTPKQASSAPAASITPEAPVAPAVPQPVVKTVSKPQAPVAPLVQPPKPTEPQVSAPEKAKDTFADLTGVVDLKKGVAPKPVTIKPQAVDMSAMFGDAASHADDMTTHITEFVKTQGNTFTTEDVQSDAPEENVVSDEDIMEVFSEGKEMSVIPELNEETPLEMEEKDLSKQEEPEASSEAVKQEEIPQEPVKIPPPVSSPPVPKVEKPIAVPNLNINEKQNNQENKTLGEKKADMTQNPFNNNKNPNNNVAGGPRIPAAPKAPSAPAAPAVNKPSVARPLPPNAPRPAAPAVPARPAAPAAPRPAVRPAVPPVPAKPAVPAAPARPAVPATPAKPAVPAKPAPAESALEPRTATAIDHTILVSTGEIYKKNNWPLEIPLNPMFTFDNMDMASNRFAHATAMSVIDNIGSMHNPFMVYGEGGTGKTHFLNAMGYEISKQIGQEKIFFTNGVRFSRGVQRYVEEGNIAHLEDFFSSVEVLIVDDIHLTAVNEHNREFISRVLNRFLQEKKQILISSKYPPESLARFEELVRFRLDQGWVSELKKPRQQHFSKIYARMIEDSDLGLSEEQTQGLLTSDKEDLGTIARNIKRAKVLSRRINNSGLITMTYEQLFNEMLATNGENETSEIHTKAIESIVSLSRSESTDWGNFGFFYPQDQAEKFKWLAHSVMQRAKELGIKGGFNFALKSAYSTDHIISAAFKIANICDNKNLKGAIILGPSLQVCQESIRDNFYDILTHMLEVMMIRCGIVNAEDIKKPSAYVKVLGDLLK